MTWRILSIEKLDKKLLIVHRKMLGTFPKDFFKWQLPKDIFPKSVPAAALGPQHVLAAALCPLAHPSRSARPPVQLAAPQRA